MGSPVIISETVRGQGAVFVNREGKRFISEMTTRDVTSAAVSAQTGGTAFEIFDDGTVSRVAQLKACFELGLVKEGNTLEELGKNTGIDPKALAETIRVYNATSKAGRTRTSTVRSLPSRSKVPSSTRSKSRPPSTTPWAVSSSTRRPR